MPDVLACTYRYVAQGQDGPVRVVLRPGADASKLPEDVKKELKDRKLLVPKNRLTADGVRLPVGHPDAEEPAPEPEAESEPVAPPEPPKQEDDPESKDKK